MQVPDIDFSDLTPRQAIENQKELVGQVVLEPLLGSVSSVAGIDVGIRAGIARSSVVVLSYPELKVIEYRLAERRLEFPYVPGLLGFREIPVVMGALRQLDTTPDVLICDGQGLAHPRRLGIASHLGILLDHPTVGCAKSRLIGEHEPVSVERGSWQPLVDEGETIGAVLRTRTAVKPVYVSPGHRADLPTSIALVSACAPKYRLPETTRLAHMLATVGSEQFSVWLARRKQT